MNSPYNLNIERSVLASYFFEPDNLETSSLKPDDFYFPAHQKIFKSMQELLKEEMPIDEEFIRKRVNKDEVSDEVLIDILSSNPITKVQSYESEIIEDSKKRAILSLRNTIGKLNEDNTSSSDSIDTIQKELNIIDGEDTSLRDTSQIVDSYNKQFNIASQNKGPIGLKTSITRLNNTIGAFAPGDLVVIGARPSMGKTSLGINFSNDFLNNDDGVLFDSLEMPGEKIIQRFIASRNQESLSDLKKGLVKDYNKYHEALKYLSTNKNFILHDISNLTFQQLIKKAKKILRNQKRNNQNIKAWIIDHAGYIKTNPMTRRQELSDGTKELKKVAKEFGIVVFLLSQLNREVQNRKSFRPILSDLKESGNLEEDADIVIFPHRDSYYKRTDRNQTEEPINKAELIIPKNRDGVTGIVPCSFNGPTNTFSSESHYIEIEYQTNESNSSSIELPDIL